MSLADLVTGAGAAPVWLADARSDRVVRRAELPDLVAAWRGHLEHAAVPAGAVVGLHGGDPLAVATAWLGILAAGRVVAPVAPDLPPARLTAWQGEVGPVLVVDADPGPGAVARERGATPVAGPVSPDGGVLLTSSGTTGPPKLVRLTTAQLLHTARNVVTAHRLTPADRGFNPLPLHHVNAEVVGLLSTLTSGGTLVLDERFHRTGIFELLEEREITWLNAVPAVLALLLRGDPPPRPLPRLRFVRSASAPLPAPVREGIAELLGRPVVETYGMTEAGSQITASDLDAPVPGSVGRPVGVELRVLDDAGEAAAPGAVGRVQIRGPGVVTSYASAAGAESFTADGWLDTGDLGSVDGTGSLFLAGRRDDVINRGGEKIFPRAVEDVLLADRAVRGAAVVGWPDDVLGQVPVAALVADDQDVPGLLRRLDAACAQRLDRVRRPTRYFLLDALPGGVNGKISRTAVLALLHAPDAPEGRTP